MKDLKGTIKTESRTSIQRVEGCTQSPQFMINDEVYYVYSMEESYVTTGVDGEHHVLNAVVGIEDNHSKKGVQWFNLHMNYNANTWSLTKTEDPHED